MLRMLSKYVGLSLAVLCLVTPLAMAQTMTGTVSQRRRLEGRRESGM